MKLIPIKHLLIARDGSIYWYVGDKLSTYNQYGKLNLIECGGRDVNRLLSDGWDNKLLAKRDGFWNIWTKNAREKDIIFIYEITDMAMWLKIFHEHEFIKPYMLTKFTHKPYAKLVYELIDGVPDFDM